MRFYVQSLIIIIIPFVRGYFTPIRPAWSSSSGSTILRAAELNTGLEISCRNRLFDEPIDCEGAVPAQLHLGEVEAFSDLLVDCLGFVGEVKVLTHGFYLREVVKLWNLICRWSFVAEVGAELRIRAGARLPYTPNQPPSVALRGRESIIIVLIDPVTGVLCGGAELCLEPRSNYLPSIRLVSAECDESTLSPYIYNVGVAPWARRRGLARRLIRLCESISLREWG